jgi:integrase
LLPELPHIPLHALRYTHARLLVEAAVPLKVVKERLGHASVAITADLYSHVSQAMQRSAVDEFSAMMLSGGLTP